MCNGFLSGSKSFAHASFHWHIVQYSTKLYGIHFKSRILVEEMVLASLLSCFLQLVFLLELSILDLFLGIILIVSWPRTSSTDLSYLSDSF